MRKKLPIIRRPSGGDFIASPVNPSRYHRKIGKLDQSLIIRCQKVKMGRVVIISEHLDLESPSGRLLNPVNPL
jgi:hypothetical protein